MVKLALAFQQTVLLMFECLRNRLTPESAINVFRDENNAQVAPTPLLPIVLRVTPKPDSTTSRLPLLSNSSPRGSVKPVATTA